MAVRGGQYNSGAGSRTMGSRGATTGGSANRGTQSSTQPGGGHTRRDGERMNSQRELSGQQMSEAQVVGFLGRKIWQSMNDESGDLSQVRQENFNYYIGDEYGDERDGYSKFVTRETLEVVEWVLPSVLRVFLGGDDVVSFEPTEPGDEESAKQETAIVNHFVMKQNNRGEGGFLSLHHWMKDCLMYPNGYLKAWIREQERIDVGTVTGLTPMGVQFIVDDPSAEILEQRTRLIAVPAAAAMQEQMSQQAMAAQQQQAQPPMPGQPMQQGPMQGQPLEQGQEPPVGYVPMEVFDLKVRTSRMVSELAIMPVPPEECLVDNDLQSLNLDDADFVCHRVRKPYTQLVNEGFDPDELDQVGLGEDYQWNDERVNRLFYEDEDPDAEDEDDPSMRTFWVHECYVWFDFNGDGVAEHRRVVLIGDRVFENEEINYQPMIAMSAVLMQHKHTGMGYVDIMKDLQVLISTLTRQMLDNIYAINVKKKFFSEDSLTEDGSTMEALLNRQAEFVPVRGPAANAVIPDQTPSMIGEILPVIQYAKEQVAIRSGVTPESGVAANDLQEVRQEVFNNAIDRASQRIEMLVRIFAETGYRQLMLKVHQLLRSHWDVAATMKIRGKWVDVDPQGWRDRTEMNVEVGLGYNTKSQQMGMLVQLLSMQREAAGQGMSDPKRIYNGLEKLINASGMGDVRSFFVDPESPEYQPPQPPPPPPEAILAQAQAQALGQEQQRKAMEAQMKFQTDAAKAQADAKKSEAEAAKFTAEMQLKSRELDIKEAELVQAGAMSEAELANKQADTQVKLAQADKAMAEAAATAVEAGETFTKAVEIVSMAGEQNTPAAKRIPELEVSVENENGGEGQADTEGDT